MGKRVLGSFSVFLYATGFGRMGGILYMQGSAVCWQIWFTQTTAARRTQLSDLTELPNALF